MIKYKDPKFRHRLDIFFKRTIPLFIIILTFMLSLLVVYRYGYISERIKKIHYNPFESKQFDRSLMYADYYLYYMAHQSENDNIGSPADFYLTNSTIDTMMHNIDINYYSGALTEEIIKDKFNKSFKPLGEFINNSNGNLKYYVQNLKTGYSMTNFIYADDTELFKDSGVLLDVIKDGRNISKIKDEKLKKKYERLVEKIEKNYRFYAVGEYDSDGKLNLKYVYGADFDTTTNNLLEVESDISIKGGYSVDDTIDSFENYRVKPITNMRHIYCIPKNIEPDFYNSNDSISTLMFQKEKEVYESVIEMAWVVWFIVVMIALITRFRYMHYNNVFYTGDRFPLEILIGILGLLFMLYFEEYFPVKVIRETVNGNIVKSLIENGISIRLSKVIANAMNVLYWYILYRVTYFIIYHLKYIGHMGIIKYLKKKSLTIMLILWTAHHVRKYLKKIVVFLIDMLKIDLSKKYNKLTVVGLVFVLSWIFLIEVVSIKAPSSVYWIVGLFTVAFLAFMYICIKEMDSINDDYNSLIEITSEIANGNLEKNIEVFDLGLFEDVKYKLQDIQKVYKKALEEEVKSQTLKSELISNVSHDLKTPLTSIITYVDLLESADNLEDAKEYISTINRKAERLKILIDDLFEITKAQTGNIVMDMMPIDIVELLKMSISEISSRLEERGIKLKTSYPDEKIIVNLDGEKTYRVFENLLVNMAKYAMSNSRAYVQVEKTFGKVDIVFRNISATEIDYEAHEILERFRRGDKSRSTDGSGLGMSIAKSYVELQGGSLEIVLDGDLFKVIVTFCTTK